MTRTAVLLVALALLAGGVWLYRTVVSPSGAAIEWHVAGPGVRYARAVQDGRFVGYRIEVDHDGPGQRVHDGAIVVAIDGVPVEDSAAGSELMLIGLMDTGRRLELYSTATPRNNGR